VRAAGIVTTIAGAIVAGMSASACALEVSQLDVSHEKSRFTVEAVAHVDVPIQTAYDILTDYGHLDLLDSQVLESRVLERPEPNVVVVWMRVRGCIVFVCRELEQVERIEEDAPNAISLAVLPERSDVKFETASWRLEATATGTKLYYSLQVEPGSWVPFFAHGSVERKLRASFLGALDAIEKIAGARDTPS
jgi:Polyketide cyclase / dehydrase and lipid transport